ncbi:hypothetical protein [Desulfovibrio sp. JC022]|uniref:hypothetical protein n=1 Tax=Desulfovibrio sp. JC022 TaxID=2593642 RepID=UPI0013D4F042|nr:hypothetical protein [Desulfovibrio sp. JC022]NDV23524.1 hypothetical protein [Desulfovibrio sp. JC022]
MFTSSVLSGSSTAGSYFSNIANNSQSAKTPNISNNLSPTQIRRQLQMQFATMSFGLNAGEQQQVNGYFSQLNNIYGVNDSSIREEQEKKFKELKKELDELYGLNKEPKKLTAEEQKKVDDLQTKLDELYEIVPTKDPEGADRTRAESLKWELKKLYYPEGKILTAAEKRKEGSIQKELKEIFGITGPKNLSKEEQATADDLNKQIDEIRGTTKKELNEEEKKRADAILLEMEKIAGSLVTHGLSNAEKNLYYKLDEQSDALKAKAKESTLSDEEQDKLAKITEHINTLLDKAEKIQEQQDKQAGQVHGQLNGFFSQLGMTGGGTLLSRSI